MKYFQAQYMAPASVLKEWMARPEEERKAEDEKMMADWDEWLKKHADAVKNTVGLGKTKRVTASGIEDITNDMMLSSYVEAESPEAAAELFKDHPHLGIRGASIEIMETRPVPTR